jgi:4-amino-4-deoxy-L-arabinose transferase-like glycosyltransferase
VRSIRRDAPINWLWAGAIAGLGLENKYTIVMFLFGLVVGLVFTPARKWFGTWQLWAAGALAMLIFAPNLIWEIVHHFPFLEWQKYIRAHPEVQTFNFSIRDFLLNQVLLTLPVFALWIIGLWFFLISARGRQFRFLGFATQCHRSSEIVVF